MPITSPIELIPLIQSVGLSAKVLCTAGAPVISNQVHSGPSVTGIQQLAQTKPPHVYPSSTYDDPYADDECAMNATSFTGGGPGRSCVEKYKQRQREQEEERLRSQQTLSQTDPSNVPSVIQTSVVNQNSSSPVISRVTGLPITGPGGQELHPEVKQMLKLLQNLPPLPSMRTAPIPNPIQNAHQNTLEFIDNRFDAMAQSASAQSASTTATGRADIQNIHTRTSTATAERETRDSSNSNSPDLSPVLTERSVVDIPVVQSSTNPIQVEQVQCAVSPSTSLRSFSNGVESQSNAQVAQSSQTVQNVIQVDEAASTTAAPSIQAQAVATHSPSQSEPEPARRVELALMFRERGRGGNPRVHFEPNSNYYYDQNFQPNFNYNNNNRYNNFSNSNRGW